jgi:hypothetical protein
MILLSPLSKIRREKMRLRKQMMMKMTTPFSNLMAVLVMMTNPWEKCLLRFYRIFL